VFSVRIMLILCKVLLLILSIATKTTHHNYRFSNNSNPLILRNKIIPAVIGKISYANTSGILADFRHIHPQNKGIIMTNNKHIDITEKDTFEQSVYAQFPACLHEHVEHELFYNPSRSSLCTLCKQADLCPLLWRHQ